MAIVGFGEEFFQAVVICSLLQATRGFYAHSHRNLQTVLSRKENIQFLRFSMLSCDVTNLGTVISTSIPSYCLN